MVRDDAFRVEDLEAFRGEAGSMSSALLLCLTYFILLICLCIMC